MDDEELVRRVLVALAERIAEPIAVESAAMALLHLQSGRVDVVLCDTELGPGPSGRWLLAEVARRWPTIRRCLMSGSAQETSEEFFRKPLDAAALVRVIHGSTGLVPPRR